MRVHKVRVDRSRFMIVTGEPVLSSSLLRMMQEVVEPAPNLRKHSGSTLPPRPVIRVWLIMRGCSVIAHVGSAAVVAPR